MKDKGPWSTEELEHKLEYMNASSVYDVEARYTGGKLVELRYSERGVRGRKTVTILSTTEPDRQVEDDSDL